MIYNGCQRVKSILLFELLEFVDLQAKLDNIESVLQVFEAIG